MVDIDTHDAYNIINDPKVKEENDIRMAVALIKNLYKNGLISEDEYKKVRQNAEIMIAQGKKVCYTDNEDRIIKEERRHRR